MKGQLILVLNFCVLLSFWVFVVRNEPVGVIATNGHSVHNLSTQLDYMTIQEAIDANETIDGHTIFVEEGTYYENVIVNKTISLMGENRHTTIIDGNRTGVVLYVEADNLKLSGFTIRNAGGWTYPGFGVILNNSDGCTIYGNIITLNPAGGIWITNESSGNLIYNNQILDNGSRPPDLRCGNGIELWHSNNNIISNNSISNNVVSGTVMDSSHSNIVNHNTFTNNSIGVGIVASYGNIISDNNMTSNGNGISIVRAKVNTIEHNLIFRNDIGIGLGFSETNTIRENNITENKIHGIALADISPNNTIIGNTISRNKNGIKIHYSNGSTIFHNNFMNNTRNVPGDVYPNVNTWDAGYPSGGNYWSDYNHTDSDNDGIGSTPHIIDANNQDNYPLKGMFSDISATSKHHIQTICNSTISHFRFDGTEISFNITGQEGTTGFCRILVPTALMNKTYTVLVNGTEVSHDLLPFSNATHSYLYFTYNNSTQEVTIIPEFPSFIILPLFMTITFPIFTAHKRKNPQSARKVFSSVIV
jgi:parallel beta-helix repeat protein